MALYIPEDVCTQIESYMNLCESCSRYNYLRIISE